MNDTDHNDEDLEVYERIPWSELLAEHRGARQWMPYVAVALVVGAATAGFILINRRGSTTTLSLTPQETVVATPANAPPVPDPPQPLPAAPQLYSEADLMANLPRSDDRHLASRAEWFVTDFFTLDGDEARLAALAEHLPAGALPSGGPAGTGVRTYVEWAKTVSIEEVSPARFNLLVAFRTLSAAPDRPFARDPVRAVVVPLLVDGNGEPAIADLPTPSEVPIASASPDWGVTRETPPAHILDQARSMFGRWGADPQIFEASTTDVGWRIVGSVTDSAGAIWPLVIRITAPG